MSAELLMMMGAAAAGGGGSPPSGPCSLVSLNGFTGIGSLTLPAVTGSDVLILKERDGSLRPGWTSVLDWSAGARPFYMSYIQGQASQTITTTGDALYWVVSNFGSVGQVSGSDYDTGSNSFFRIPALSGLDAGGGSFILYNRYNNREVAAWASVDSPWSLAIVPGQTEGSGAYIEGNVAASLSGHNIYPSGGSSTSQHSAAAVEILNY